MRTPRTNKPKEAEIPVSVLDQTEADIPQMGIGQVIEEEIRPWDDEARLAEEEMAGDMAKLLMEQIKTLPRHWGAMTENQQTDVWSTVSAGCANLASRAIEMMASRGRRIVKGVMKRVTIQDEIQLLISCQRSPEACTAMGMAAAGGEVAFLLLHTEGFLQLGSPIDIGPKQGVLDFETDPVNNALLGDASQGDDPANTVVSDTSAETARCPL